MHYITLHCITLHCIALHCIALHCIALHCIALHCIALHCIAIALHCIPSAFGTAMLFSFFPADVKRKKPESKSLSVANLITSAQKSNKSSVQSREVQDRSQVHSKSRYQYLPTAHNYPTYPSQKLVRQKVHMPFITPFAVNPGSTFINLGSNSSLFGKHGEQDQSERIAHSNAQDEEKQLLQQPESEKLDKTEIATETFSPWRHHSYQVTQEPATTPMNTAYGNEVGYQVMIQNQVKYANYTPSQSTNYVYSSLPLVTSYRNYGDNPESTYYPSLMNYNGPANSIVSLPYRTPHMQERSHNNVTTIKSHRSGLKSESFPSCDSRFPEHSGNVFSNVSNEAASQCVLHENTAFTYITANDQEK